MTEKSGDSNRVVVLTENAEEVSIANVGVAFEHQLHQLEQQRTSSSGVRIGSVKSMPSKPSDKQK